MDWTKEKPGASEGLGNDLSEVENPPGVSENSSFPALFAEPEKGKGTSISDVPPPSERGVGARQPALL